MKENLDSLKNDIEAFLASGDFIVFRACPRALDPNVVVSWDHERFPDFRQFLDTARAAGVRMVVFHHSEFTADLLDDAGDKLNTADLPREEKRNLERRLRELRVYEGFTCSIELSFDHQDRTYVYELDTEWYEELLDIIDDIDATLPEDEEEDEGPIGGYFSRN